MDKFTKGGKAGGWIHIQDGKLPIGLVHPKYVDKLLAAPDMYEALQYIRKEVLEANVSELSTDSMLMITKSLSKANGKEIK